MLTVALLGVGTVGSGVLARLRDCRVLTARRDDDPVALAGGGCDIVIELMGGMEPAATAIRTALLAGSHVVTANKAVVAEYGPAFETLAAACGVGLRYSAAVGGGVPVLRTLSRLPGMVARVDGVLNGTTNFVLDRMAAGVSWDDAIAAAQRLGFAEADPAKDLDGTDAAQKITIVARHAFGRAPDRLTCRGIAPGTRGRLVASTWAAAGAVHAAVRPAASEPPFSLARNEENVVQITLRNGRRLVLWGRGAGREPTAAAVIRDVLELAALRRHGARRTATTSP